MTKVLASMTFLWVLYEISYDEIPFEAATEADTLNHVVISKDPL